MCRFSFLVVPITLKQKPENNNLNNKNVNLNIVVLRYGIQMFSLDLVLDLLIGQHLILFFLCQLLSLCSVGLCIRVNNFSSKTTRPRDMLFFYKDTLTIVDEKLFEARKSVCLSVS